MSIEGVVSHSTTSTRVTRVTSGRQICMPCMLVRPTASRWVRLPQFRATLTSGGVWLGLAESGCVVTWFGPGLRDLPVKGGPDTAIRITDDMMTLEIDDRAVASARLSEHAAVDGHGAWIVSAHPGGLFTP